jgi:hypothetical protein
MGRDDAVLIRQDGTLAAFGRSALIANVPAGFYRAVTVAGVHAVAIGDDGNLTAWGSDIAPPPSPPLTGLLNAPQGGPFKEVDSRTLYSLALHEDGTIYGWGQAANGTNVLAGWTPTPEDSANFYVPGEVFKTMSAGNVHALAVRPDGTVAGWGNATGGALAPPTHVKFKAVAAGWGFSLGLSTDGILWGWGTPIRLVSPPGPFPTQAWTFASEGWTRYGDSQHYYIPNERFQSISAAAFHAMAITADSTALLQYLQEAVIGKGIGRLLEITIARAQLYNAVPNNQTTCAIMRVFDLEVRATWKLSMATKRSPPWKITTDQMDDWLAQSGKIQIELDCKLN